MIADKNLGGLQLYADNAFNSEFVRNYKVNGIPRFILIDIEIYCCSSSPSSSTCGASGCLNKSK